jgi:hypothetical protein
MWRKNLSTKYISSRDNIALHKVDRLIRKKATQSLGRNNTNPSDLPEMYLFTIQRNEIVHSGCVKIFDVHQLPNSP